MLAPAAATVCAAVVLIVGMKAVAAASTELRKALRKFSATIVAGDELSRSAVKLGDHAETTKVAASNAAGRLRHRRRLHKPDRYPRLDR